jgi:hypothetical protein
MEQQLVGDQQLFYVHSGTTVTEKEIKRPSMTIILGR